jgi:hypothetical protein
VPGHPLPAVTRKPLPLLACLLNRGVWSQLFCPCCPGVFLAGQRISVTERRWERRPGRFRVRLPLDPGRWKWSTPPRDARVMLESAVTALAVIGLVGVIHGASSATTHQAAAANSLNAQAPRFAVPSAARTAPPGAKPSPTPAATRPAATLMPASPASAGCQPLSDEGTCYEPGEFCRDDDHGMTGLAGDGETITCEDNDGWRWEPT